VRWRNEEDRAVLDALVKAYGYDALILEVTAQSTTAANVRGADPAEAQILSRFAADVRGAVRRREDDRTLLSTRRDWPRETWISWLQSEASRDGLALRSQYIAALEAAGCPNPKRVVNEHITAAGLDARTNRTGSLPADEGGWVTLLVSSWRSLQDIAERADVAGWLIEQGCPGHWIGRILIDHRAKFPERIRNLLPEPKSRQADDSAKAPAHPRKDISLDDETVFEVEEE